MTLVDFYILPQADDDSRYQFLMKLATRAIGAGHRLYIHTDTEQIAQRLSERLWQATSEDFLPNALPSDPHYAPIRLGWAETHLPEKPDMLINLSIENPTGDASFARIAEIVTQADPILDITRQRFKEYQNRGITPRMHDMRKRNR